MCEDEKPLIFSNAQKLEIYHRRYQGFLQLQELKVKPKILDIRFDLLEQIKYYDPSHKPV